MRLSYRFASTTAGILCTLLLVSGCGSDTAQNANDLENNLVSGEAQDNTDGSIVADDEAGTGTNSDGSSTGSGTGNANVDPADTNTGTPDLVAENEALYKATFNATWSADTHPIKFPDNPHFSPLTGAVHSEQSHLWEVGQIASDGIEQMAESGATAILLDEIQSVINEGRALVSIEGAGITKSPGNVSVEFTIDRDNALVTLVSMLAPSPDWFVGVDGLSLIDQNGDFIPSVTVDLVLYDAGTDSATNFTSRDEDTAPRSPIGLVNSFPDESDFIEGEPYVGQLVFEKIQ